MSGRSRCNGVVVSTICGGMVLRGEVDVVGEWEGVDVVVWYGE